MATKQELRAEIESLKVENSELRMAEFSLKRQRENLESQLVEAEEKIKALLIENDTLTHTPEFAADTQAAFDRGKNDGVRSLAWRTQSDMVNFVNDMYVEMNNLLNKYTRGLSFEMFLGNVEEASGEVNLPDTDKVRDMIANRAKV